MLLMVMALLMTSDGVSVPLYKPILLGLVGQPPVPLAGASDERLDDWNHNDVEEDDDLSNYDIEDDNDQCYGDDNDDDNLSCEWFSEIFVKSPVQLFMFQLVPDRHDECHDDRYDDCVDDRDDDCDDRYAIFHVSALPKDATVKRQMPSAMQVLSMIFFSLWQKRRSATSLLAHFSVIWVVKWSTQIPDEQKRNHLIATSLRALLLDPPSPQWAFPPRSPAFCFHLSTSFYVMQ